MKRHLGGTIINKKTEKKLHTFSIPEVKPEGCQANGVIVVGIRVNREGKVIKATPGINVTAQK